MNNYNENCYKNKKATTNSKLYKVAGTILLGIIIPLTTYVTIINPPVSNDYTPICEAIAKGENEAYAVVNGINTTFDLTEDMKSDILKSGKCTGLNLYTKKEAIAVTIQSTPPEVPLTVYERAGERFGVPPSILEAVHSKETTGSSYVPYTRQGGDGYTCIVSPAGAMGVMQFMPLTWEAYKIDGDDDGDFDKCEVVDAVFTASNYLRANYDVSGSWSNAIWRYNHSDIYVNEILRRAELLRQGEEIYPLTIKND